MWTIRPVRHDEWPALAGFIHPHNRRPDGRARCLHAESGASEQDHRDELCGLRAGEACFVAAREGGTLRGLAGAEFDAELQRAWLRGPLTDTPDDGVLRLELLAALHAELPQAQRFDAFPCVDESALRESLRRFGYRDHVQHHVMQLRRPASVPAWHAAVRDASAADAVQAVALHEALFPATYLTGASMLASRDADHRLLVVARPGSAQIAGYLYAQYRPLDNEAHVDFIGIAPDARGLGLGRALLDAALNWCFSQRGLSGVSLTVRQDRPNALRLYESAGFREIAAGAQMIFERAAPAAARQPPETRP
jgi:ribosomal protein S18 acetylase RimI-like enzyme